MQTILKYLIALPIFIFLVLIIWLFFGSPKKAEKITWGVNFSVKQSDFLELDPKENYLAILDDLKAKNIKISVHWDLIEPENNVYDFKDLDWQVIEAQKRDVNLILAIGMKTPRWPECHLPQWAWNLNKEEQQNEILKYLEEIVFRYKDYSNISAWQVENEPFFKFGSCPWSDESFLKKEVLLVKQLDPPRPIIITDSGEISTWNKAAKIGDLVGFTTYRNVWQEQVKGYFSYNPWLTPMFYSRRAQLVKQIYHKKAIGIELQAEPWCRNSIMNASLKEQEKTMSLDHFKQVISFARNTGIDTYYFWGAEWWHWMKTKQGHPEYWEEAKKVFSE